MFQSLSRDSGRLNRFSLFSFFPHRRVFQSLSRDSGRLNRPGPARGRIPAGPVSIPQSGFGAFEPCPPIVTSANEGMVSIPQSGFGAFELRSESALAFRDLVSIPQSGFGAFERSWFVLLLPFPCMCFNPSVGIRGV